MFAKLRDRLFGNEFERMLARAVKHHQTRFLIYWNRGLGDIALGLYALFETIRKIIPDAKITVVTRPELEQAFSLLNVAQVLVVPDLVRRRPDNPAEAFKRLKINHADFDVVLVQVNPTKWLFGQLGRMTPRLHWKPEYDDLCRKFDLLGDDKFTIGAHVNSETGHLYGYVKDWPVSHWQELFHRLAANPSVRIILFGHGRDNSFSALPVIDLRGNTSFLEMLSIIKNRCDVLIAPDSGILSMAFYLDSSFPLTLISLWADPRQGVLKQAVDSPNPGLRHFPLLGEEEDVSRIRVEDVLRIIERDLSLWEKSVAEHAIRNNE